MGCGEALRRCAACVRCCGVARTWRWERVARGRPSLQLSGSQRSSSYHAFAASGPTTRAHGQTEAVALERAEEAEPMPQRQMKTLPQAFMCMVRSSLTTKACGTLCTRTACRRRSGGVLVLLRLYLAQTLVAVGALDGAHARRAAARAHLHASQETRAREREMDQMGKRY